MTITLPDPSPGSSSIMRENGHQIDITTISLATYRVECLDCGDAQAALVLDAGTQDPIRVIERHIANRPRHWPEGLDWNGTGRWAVVMMLSGSSGTGWTVHPSVSVSRWETHEHAVRHAVERAAQKAVARTAVVEWGDDLRGDLLAIPRVRDALADKDKHGRVLAECPENRRSQYPKSPDCCGRPMMLCFARAKYEGERMTMIGGYLLRCASCVREEPVDLVVSQLSGSWVREVL